MNCPNCGRHLDKSKPERGHDNCLVAVLLEVLLDRGYKPADFDIEKIDAADIWTRFGGPAADIAANQMGLESYPGEVQFGDIEVTPFHKEDDGAWPLDTNYLYELSDGQTFEDAQGRMFNKVGHGPAQGSVEVVDDDEVHAYFDVSGRFRPCQ